MFDIANLYFVKYCDSRINFSSYLGQMLAMDTEYWIESAVFSETMNILPLIGTEKHCFAMSL